MSVAGDGKDEGESGGEAPVAPFRTRHRVPPSTSAAARVLPEPFTPAKPTIPTIPHQRRPDGPTAVAIAAIPAPAGPSEDPDAGDPDAPDPATVGTLAGEARADAAETLNVEFIVTLPGGTLTNDPDLAPTAPAAPTVPAAATVPAAPAEPAAPAALAAPAVPAALAAPAAPVADAVETVDGELMSADTTMSMPILPADDSPTVADYVPAFAVVTESDSEDGEDYRGTRRRTAPWRRYPVGAVAVAVIILLVTAAVVFQLAGGDDSGGSRNDGLPPNVPGVNVPGGPVPAGVASPSAEGSPSASAAAPSPSATRGRTGSATTTPGPSDTPSTPSARASVSPTPPASVRLVGKQSGKCIEYRAEKQYAVVLDNCDPRAGNQQFRLQGDRATGAQLVADNGMCLHVANAAAGTAVQVAGCNGNPNQQWIRNADNTWQNKGTRRCLDAAYWGTNVGTPLIIWDCRSTNNDNQIWTLT